MIKHISDVIKSESCFILSSNPCFVHDLFLSSYVVKDKLTDKSLFTCTRIITGLSDEKREEQSNILPDFFGDESNVWLRDFFLSKQCYLKLTIWNEETNSVPEKLNYMCFEENEDDSDKSILFYLDDSLKKRVYPKFFARHEEIK